VIDVKDHKTAYELGLVENLQRHSLNPIEEANAFRSYVSELGWGGISELSIKTGKSVSYISRRLALLDLPKEIQMLISDSLLSPSCGDELCAVKNEETKTLLNAVIIRDHPTVRTIRRIKSQINNEWYGYYTPTKSDNHGKFFDKSIVSLKIAAKRIGELIGDLEDQNWILSEILMQHRNILRTQINILINQKKKYERRVRYSSKGYRGV
jgi:ParB family chromosome partitioning protein